MDGNIDPLAGLPLVRPAPEEKDKHDSLNGKLTGRLEKSVSVTAGDDTAPEEHVNDCGDEDPPVALLVVVVEETVLAPGLLVFVQRLGVALGLFVLASQLPDAESEESEDTGEYRECDGGEGDGSPRITVGKLENAVQSPYSVQDQDQVGDGSGEKAPVVLAEIGQLGREGTEESPDFKDDLEEEDTDGDGTDDDGENQENGHEGVVVGDGVLLDVALDAADHVVDPRGIVVVAGTFFRGFVDGSGEIAEGEESAFGEVVYSTFCGAGRFCGGVVWEDEGGILEEFVAAGGEVAARFIAEAVDGLLHVAPGDDSSAESKVAGETAVDARVVDAQHAVGGDGLEPTDDFCEAGTRGGRTGVAGGSYGGDAGHDQCGTSHPGRDIGDGRDFDSFAVPDVGFDTAQGFTGFLGLQLQGGLPVEVGDGEGNGGDHVAIFFGDGLITFGSKIALGY